MKILIITDIFRSSPRIPGLVKNLILSGWEVVILSPEGKSGSLFGLLSKGLRILEVPYKGDIFIFWRKLFFFFGLKEKNMLNQVKEKVQSRHGNSFISFIFYLYLAVFAFPDEEKKWKKPAIKILSDFLNKEKVDVILSSSSPVTAHIVGHDIKKKFNIPWAADLRDLWSQNHNYKYGPVRKFFDRILEIKILKNADCLVTVSDFLAKQLEIFHKKRAFSIPNGFDLGIVNDKPQKLTKKLTITYTGQIYDGKQNPFKILNVINELIFENEVETDDFEIRFFGPEKYILKKYIDNYRLGHIVKQCGMINRDDSIKKQRESQLLLLLNWEDKSQKGTTTGKIYEYLAAKRPIIATGGFGGDSVENILKDTKAGYYLCDEKSIKIWLKKFYNEYKKTGTINCRGSWEKTLKYSQKEMTNKFIAVFNRIILTKQ